MRTSMLKPTLVAALIAVCSDWGGANAQTPSDQWKEGVLATPRALVTEHQQLRDALARAVADPGGVGDAARAIERLLTPHLRHEEQVVLSPLGLIRGLVDDEAVADPARVFAVVEQIERELPQLLQEHRAILDATRRFRDAAGRERKPQYLPLADDLWTHVMVEDQVLYPTAVLVGRYVKMAQDPKHRRTAGHRP